MSVAIVWEQVACPLCSGIQEEELLVQRHPDADLSYRVVRCQPCGIGYLNPRPDPASIGQFYSDDYFVYHTGKEKLPSSGGMVGYLKRAVLRHWYGYPDSSHSTWVDQAAACLAYPFFRPSSESLTSIPFRGQGRLLDVGCGSGWFAARMKALGWDVVGLDFSAFAAQKAAQRYGISTLAGTLPHPEILPESFDTVTMGAMLEHVHDPKATIAAAAQILCPGGQLAISVPNLHSWCRRFFGSSWYGWQTPVHLTHFTPATLARMVASCGLTVRECRSVAKPGWMARSVRQIHREGTTKRTTLAHLARLKPIRSLLSSWTQWRGKGEAIILLAERPM